MNNDRISATGRPLVSVNIYLESYKELIILILYKYVSYIIHYSNPAYLFATCNKSALLR